MLRLRPGPPGRFSPIILLLLCVCPAPAAAARTLSQGAAAYEYICPVPGSQLINRQNNVILRLGDDIDPASLASADLVVQGTTSGAHGGTLILADDSKTLLFQPVTPFFPGEMVTVDYRGGVRTAAGDTLPAITFDFIVSPNPAEPRFDSEEDGPTRDSGRTRSVHRLSAAPEDTLPADYPGITTTFYDHPEPGYIMLAPWSPGVLLAHLMIVDDHGMPVFYRRYPNTISSDFRLQPTGLLTFFLTLGHNKYYVMDHSYTIVDSIEAGNGYLTDNHELMHLPNGHWLLMSYDPQRVDMDTVVTGGRIGASVIGLVIQELDTQRRVVFQWRSWDTMKITDSLEPLTGTRVDYAHGNAMTLDGDGDILLSTRHLSEITKINRRTGRIVWRMGPHAKNNEFTFLDDPEGFSYQHHLRRLPNGHLTVFDNGVLRNPPYSRAAEYEVDETRKTARLVWQYETQPPTYGRIMGSVQRAADGATLINWGGNPGDPGTLTHDVTELHADGSVALEMKFPTNEWSYRAYRVNWSTNLLVATSDGVDFGPVPPGTSGARSVTIRNESTQPVTVNGFASTDSAFGLTEPLPVTLLPGQEHPFALWFRPDHLGPFSATVYVRSVNDTQLVARDVAVRGIGGFPADSHVRPVNLRAEWPNPFEGSSTFRFDVLRRVRVRLRIFDATGRRVATLENEMLDPGTYTRRWDAGATRPGVYYVRLSAGGVSDSRAVVLRN